MKHKKICISKKVGYVSFFLFLLLSFVIANNLFLQKKTTYKSKAQEISPTPTPHYLTSDPRKIMEFWKKHIIERRKNQIPPPFTNNTQIDTIKNLAKDLVGQLTYSGDLDYERDYESAMNGTIFCTVGNLTDPFGLIFNEIKEGTSTDKWNSMLYQSKITLSFFYGPDGQELSLLVASWLGPNATLPYSMRYIPNKSLINAFSTVLFADKGPLLSNDDMKVSGCGDSKYKKWKKWAKYALADSNVTNILVANQPEPITPTPNLFQKRSADRFQLSTLVNDFMERFKLIYKNSYPEAVLYPLVDDKKSLKSISSVFNTKYSDTKLWSFSEKKPQHLTYFFDKCPSDASGHFYQLLTVLNTALMRGVEADKTGQLVKIGEADPWTIFVVRGRTFINYPLNHDQVSVVGTCLNDYSRESVSQELSACPDLPKNIYIDEINSVFITFKSIKDESCKKYEIKDETYIHYGDDSKTDMTFLLYLGKQ